MANGDANGTAREERQFKSEEASIYLELAKMSQESFLNRRSYEWKVAFGLWTAIGLITYFMVDKADSFNGTVLVWLGVLYAIVWVCWLLAWQFPLRLAFEQDKHYKHYYMNRAEGWNYDMPEREAADWRNLIWRFEHKDWKWSWRRFAWTFGQTVFTFAFLLGSWVAISTAIEKPTAGDAKIEVKASGGNVKIQTEAGK